VSPYEREADEPMESDPGRFQRRRERISEKLQGDEVVGREKLMLV